MKDKNDKNSDHAEAMELFKKCQDFDRDNREKALEDLQFYAGFQWRKTDLDARQGRPCLTINQLPQFVQHVVGDMRTRPPAINVKPQEDADIDIAEIRAGLIRSIEVRCEATGSYLSAAEQMVISGEANLKIRADYNDDDNFDQELLIEYIPSPTAVVWDFMSTERTGRDAEYCFVMDELPKDEFKRRFENDDDDDDIEVNKSTSDIETPADWGDKDTVKIAEYWRIKRAPIWLHRDEYGKIHKITKEEARLYPPETVREVVKKTAVRQLMTGSKFIGGEYEIPINRLPIIRLVGRITDTGSGRYREGLVRQAKDPQRLKNYWRSIAAELLVKQPRASFLATESAVRDKEDAFRESWMSGDPLLIQNNEGSITPLNPPAFPSALHQEAQINTDDMKAVTGIYDSSMGARSNETSGRAIIAREKQGDTANFIYHDNLAASIRAVGDVLNQLIDVIYDTERIVQILGEDMSERIVKINFENDDDSFNITKGKYDVVIDTGASYRTRREESSNAIMEFVRVLPQAGQVAGDLIAKSQDWPLADEMAKRLKSLVPPAALDNQDEAAQDPQKQQAIQMQMQAQQMQQQAAQAKIEADIRLAQANAMKAEAEAMKAKIEAEEAAMNMRLSSQEFFEQEMGNPDYSQPAQGFIEP